MNENIISQVSDYLFGFLKNNKGIQTIKSDFGEAITNEILIFWNKVRPIFIEEDKILIEQIEKDPENETLKGGLKYQISKKMDNVNFANEASSLIARIDILNEKSKGGDTNIGIIASEVKMEGKNVAGIQNINKSWKKKK